MAKKARIEFNKNLEQEFRDLPIVAEMVAHHVEAIAAACNADSSWDDPKVGGGYFSSAQSNPTLGRVWSVDRQRSESRKNRMIRLLDSGA